jgi:hypothetical protein
MQKKKKTPNLATNFKITIQVLLFFLQTNPHKFQTQCEKELQFYYIHELGEGEKECVSFTLKSSQLKKQQYGIVEHVQLTRTKSTLHFFLMSLRTYSIYVLDS